MRCLGEKRERFACLVIEGNRTMYPKSKLGRLTVLSVVCLNLANGQNQAARIQAIIDKMSVDSLVTYVRVLSGDTTVQLGDSSVRITGRSEDLGRSQAMSYIRARLQSFGLSTEVDSFVVFPRKGANVLAIQEGAAIPSGKVMIGAHYDAAGISPGADDDASGCAAVLEIARVLSKYNIDKTIVYAFWDLEELGLEGSRAHAEVLATGHDSVSCVFDLDMIGFDGDDNQVGELFSRNIANSRPMADSILAFVGQIRVGVQIRHRNIDSPLSDYYSFYDHGYSAVLLSEEGGDNNPYIHSYVDRLDRFNLVTFLGLARVAAASIASLAGVGQPTSVPSIQDRPAVYALSQNYPNPFNPTTTIRYDLPQLATVELQVFDVLGQEVGVLASGWREPGFYTSDWNARDYSSGVYLARLIVRDQGGRLKYHGVIKILLAK